MTDSDRTPIEGAATLAVASLQHQHRTGNQLAFICVVLCLITVLLFAAIGGYLWNQENTKEAAQDEADRVAIALLRSELDETRGVQACRAAAFATLQTVDVLADQSRTDLLVAIAVEFDRVLQDERPERRTLQARIEEARVASENLAQETLAYPQNVKDCE